MEKLKEQFPKMPDGAMTTLYGWEVTEAEKPILEDLGLRNLNLLKSIRARAEGMATQLYGSEGKVCPGIGVGNAFQHVYFSGLLELYFPGRGEKLTNAHEIRPNNDPMGELMDLHNNKLGRDLVSEASRKPSLFELAMLAQEAVDSGRAAHGDGRREVAPVDRSAPVTDVVGRL
jgi:hypothetical protein